MIVPHVQVGLRDLKFLFKSPYKSANMAIVFVTMTARIY